MGASATNLSKFDIVQKSAERLSGCVFPALQFYHAISTIELLCSLLDFCRHRLLHFFCPAPLCILLIHKGCEAYHNDSFFPLL